MSEILGKGEGQPLKIERGKGIYKVPVNRYVYIDPSTPEGREETKKGRIKDVLIEKGLRIPEDAEMVVLHVKNPGADIRVIDGGIYAHFEETELWSFLGWVEEKGKRRRSQKSPPQVERTQLGLGGEFSK